MGARVSAESVTSPLGPRMPIRQSSGLRIEFGGQKTLAQVGAVSPASRRILRHRRGNSRSHSSLGNWRRSGRVSGWQAGTNNRIEPASIPDPHPVLCIPEVDRALGEGKLLQLLRQRDHGREQQRSQACEPSHSGPGDTLHAAPQEPAANAQFMSPQIAPLNSTPSPGEDVKDCKS